MFTPTLLVLALTLSACASRHQAGVHQAAMTPLNDLNLAKIDIPPVLQKAREEPYLVPAPLNCETLAAGIAELDDALGPDVDAPKDDTKESMAEKGGKAVEGAAMGALQNTSESVIPFRGWVRKLTGAARHSKKVTEAIHAGSLKRAFLKGLRSSQPCAIQTETSSSAPV
jgi:hypothetical protein